MRNAGKVALLAALLVAAIGVSTSAMAAAGAATMSPSLVTAGQAEVIEILDSTANYIAAAPAGAASVSFVSGGNTYFGTVFKVVDATHVIVTAPVGAGNSLTKGAWTVNVLNGAGAPVALSTGTITVTGANRVLQVSVNMTLGATATIAWDTTTDNDDSPNQPASMPNTHKTLVTITPFVWYVRDADFGVPPALAQINLGTTYNTSSVAALFGTADADNAHTLVLLASSTTHSSIKIDAFATDDDSTTATKPWKIAGAAVPGLDQVRVTANLSGANSAGNVDLVRNTSMPLLAATATGVGGSFNTSLNLQVVTPSTSTDASGIQHTVTVSLVATGS